MDYRLKAIKYKKKYLNLKNEIILQQGGLLTCDYYDDSFYMFSSFQEIDNFIKFIYNSNPSKYEKTLLNINNKRNYKNCSFLPKSNINIFEKNKIDIKDLIDFYNKNKIFLLATITNKKVINSINNVIIKNYELGYDSNSNVWENITRIINYFLCMRNNIEFIISLIKPYFQNIGIITDIINKINDFIPFNKGESTITYYTKFKGEKNKNIKNIDNDYSNFSINDFFNESKNISFIIPPSLILLLTLDIEHFEIIEEIINTGIITRTIPEDYINLFESFTVTQNIPDSTEISSPSLSKNKQKKEAKKALKEQLKIELTKTSDSESSISKKELKKKINEELRSIQLDKKTDSPNQSTQKQPSMPLRQTPSTSSQLHSPTQPSPPPKPTPPSPPPKPPPSPPSKPPSSPPSKLTPPSPPPKPPPSPPPSKPPSSPPPSKPPPSPPPSKPPPPSPPSKPPSSPPPKPPPKPAPSPNSSKSQPKTISSPIQTQRKT